jgi:chromosomal replication initiator protein
LPTSDLELVTALEGAIRERIGEPRYTLWFDRRTKFTWDDERLTVGVPNLHFQEWLQKTFTEAVGAAAREVFGRTKQVRFVIDPELFQAARQEQGAVHKESPERSELPQGPPPLPDRPVPAAPASGRSRRQGPSPQGPTLFDRSPFPDQPRTEPRPSPQKRARRWRRLGEFVVGACNRVAHASALSVVEEPGQGANPLVLHGPTGTGKTHLVEGIYTGLKRAHPDWRVRYVTAEDFTNRFVQAMRSGKLAGFRRCFRECDVLLLDDLHFLATKRATQEEFLHTFDALLVDGRQVVVTCDCHPRLADDFTPELTDRLLGGAVWGLTPPDPETRLNILRSRAADLGCTIPAEVLDRLADRLRGNARELEGALQNLRHYSRVTGRSIDLRLAEDVLADVLRHVVRMVHLADVDTAVCRALRLESGALQARGRSWAVSHPRMIGMFLARKHTRAAYGEIGQYFGGRNHSTVVAAEKKVRQWLQEDAELLLGDRPLRIREVIERAERELQR